MMIREPEKQINSCAGLGYAQFSGFSFDDALNTLQRSGNHSILDREDSSW